MAESFKLQKGFALPTVLISSVVMLIVLTTSVAAVASIRTSLNDQYFTKLAQQAAESGVALAERCLRLSEYQPEWNNNATASNKVLRPDSECNGNINAAYDKYVVQKDGVRTRFVVDAAETAPGGLVRNKVTGYAELLRSSNGAIWRTYEQTVVNQSSYVDNPQIGGGAGFKERGHIGYFLAGNGILYGWGDNREQVIGDASLGTYVTVPVPMELPAGTNRVKQIFDSGQGASVLCIIASDDQVYCRGDAGSLKSSTWQRFVLPSGLRALTMNVNGYGTDSACVVASNAQVYCAGENTFGTLGNTQTTNSVVPMSAPTRFALPAGVSAKSVVIKDFHTCVTSTVDEAYCSGRNDFGQLGRGNTTNNVGLGNSIPAKVNLPVTVKDIKLTYHAESKTIHYLGTNGTVYMSGANAYGTANDGSTTHTTNYSTPRQISSTGLEYESIMTIGMEALDRSAVCMIRKDPNDALMWCMGQNAMGQLGEGTCTDRGNWFVYQLPAGEKARPIINTAAEYQMNSMMVVTQSGKVFAAGDNQYGKLGTTHPLQTCNGTPREVLMPFRPGSTTERVKAVSLANGDEYTSYILSDDGNVYASGRNNNGQLGDGTIVDSSTPQAVRIPRAGISF